MKRFFLSKIWNPLLLQGLSPEKLALSVALGFACAVHPMLGATTILCLVVGSIFHLNHVAMQLVNYCAYPIQLLLLVPHLRIGEFLVHANPLHLSLTEIFHLVATQPHGSLHLLGNSLLYAMLGWVVMSLFLVPILYYSLYFALKKVPLHRLQSQKN